LEYFGEEPQFGQHCGTCDVCLTGAKYKDDKTRDFRAPARGILEACVATEDFPLPMTVLLTLIQGNWKPKNPDWGPDRRRLEAMQRVQKLRSGLPPIMMREAFTKEFIGMLCSAGYIERKKVTSGVGSGTFQRTFEVYLVTPKGKAASTSHEEIRLPVPQAIRQQEEEERRKAEKRKEELEKAGVDTKKIPVKELESGEGATVKAYLDWNRRISHWREQGKTELVQQNEELLKRIMAWRDNVAQKQRIAPAAVLSEPLLLSVAYSRTTSVDALRAAGVRIVGVEDLATLMQASLKELFPKKELDELEAAAAGVSVSAGTANENAPMRFPAGPWAPTMKWEKAVYKVSKAGKPPMWEEYYNRWARGEHCQAIAMNPPGTGKAVKTGTVFGHIMTALTFAKPVDLAKLAQQVESNSVPTKRAWEKIEEAAAVRGQNVDADDYRGKEVLCGILGAENVNREPASKSEADRALEEQWYARIRWWEALKRVRFQPAFDGAEANASETAKRPRLA